MIIVNEINLDSESHYKQRKLFQSISRTSLAALITATINGVGLVFFGGLAFSMATSEEVISIIGGLTDAIRAQHRSSKEVASRTQDQIQELSQAVAELSTSVRTQSSSSASTLRLPPLSLPEFSGGEFLDRF